MGAGVEYALSSSWSLKMEYDYLRFGGMGMGAPPTSTVTIDGNVTNNDPSGTSSITQNIHLVKIGLNYRFGAGSSSERAGRRCAGRAALRAGLGVRDRRALLVQLGLVPQRQRLAQRRWSPSSTYDNMTAHSGELFARVDAPFGLFAKGFIGGGAITGGQMYDEDWGLSSTLASVPTGYEITQSDIVGSLAYLTGDIGYNLMRGRDHKVGVFVGYNIYQATMNTMGCNQLVAPASGVCSPAAPPTQNLVSQMDTWQSIRLGVAAEARLWERFKLGGDFAFLPYVNYNGLDAHRARGLNFPWSGTGNGVQAELTPPTA